MKRNNYTLAGILTMAFIIVNLVAWPLNAYRFIKCDFSSEGSWKGEVVHGIGLVLPTYLATAWSSWDE